MSEMVVATKRFEKISPEKRAAILEAARDEFSRNGFEQSSLNEILKTAGISKGSFYYYFEDKVDLYATTITEALGPYLIRLDEVCNVDTPDAYWEELEDYIRETVEELYRNPELIRLGKGLVQLKMSSLQPQGITDLVTLSRSKIATLVERGRRAGAITTDIPDDLLVNILTGIDEALDYWSFEHVETLSLLDVEGHTLFFLKLFKLIAETHIQNSPGRL